MIILLIFPLVGIIGLVSIAISKIKCTELVEAVVIRLEKNAEDLISFSAIHTAERDLR